MAAVAHVAAAAFRIHQAMEVEMVRMTLAVTAFALAVASPAAYAADAAQMEANKKTVAALYDAVLNQKDFEKASQYLGPRYTQHNPNAADGPEGLKGFIGFLKDKFPNNRSEIKRIFADGDYVIVHVHAVREPGTRGNAIIDIFKLENGKVVEHWDVVQPIPEKAANDNTMF
jgi:predicted SnoaL-like aldol condensation-catalyzing enzyme